MELEKVEDIVKEILTDYPVARENDNALYCIYAIKYKNVKLTDEVFVNFAMYGLPAFETVSRSRRRVQESHPELTADRVRKRRAERRVEMGEYYGGVTC